MNSYVPKMRNIQYVSMLETDLKSLLYLSMLT